MRERMVRGPTEQREVCAHQGDDSEDSRQQFAVGFFFCIRNFAPRIGHWSDGGFHNARSFWFTQRTIDQDSQADAGQSGGRWLCRAVVGTEQFTKPAA